LLLKKQSSKAYFETTRTNFLDKERGPMPVNPELPESHHIKAVGEKFKKSTHKSWPMT
jgi:hypothetical protein